MSQTTAKSQTSSETCDCGAPVILKTIVFMGEPHTLKEPTCDCRDIAIAKEEEDVRNKEKRFAFERKQKDLDHLTNDHFLRGVDGEITFKGLDRTNNKRIATIEGYLDNLGDNLKDGKSFGLLGKAGRGKTALMICLHKKLIENGVTSALVNAPLFFPKLDAMGIAEREGCVEKLMKARCLFLDDLFRTDYTPAKRELIYRIIEYRYPLCLPTFFASNIYDKNAEEIRKKMVSSLGSGEVSEAIADRLFNERVWLVMFIGGESFRQGGLK